MKILYIITQSEGGGAQKYVLALAKHFKGTIAAGNEAKKLFLDAAGLQLTTYNLQHLIRNISPWHDMWATFQIRKLVKTASPDIVHLNSSKAGFLGSLGCIGLKPKVVFTAHGFIFNEPMSGFKKSFYILLEKIASYFRDFIITVSEADKTSALKNKIISASKITTVYNGIPPGNFLPRNEARGQLKLPLDKKIIATIANDYKTKGRDIFIEAFTNPIKDTAVVMVGKTNDQKTYGEIINLGFINDISKYLKAFDLLVIPSRKEGFPYVALEAMQAGIPIVASNVGGIPEALQNSGKLIPPNDPIILRNIVLDIISNQDIEKDLSNKALERSKIFTEEKMLNETEKVYKKVLGII